MSIRHECRHHGRQTPLFADDGRVKRWTKNRARFFARYLKEARTHLNLTQGELATLWGKSEALIADIELDIRPIGRCDILSLSQALGLPASELLEAAGFLQASPADIVLKPGYRVTAVVREGETGTVINLNKVMLASLKLLATKPDDDKASVSS